jgi:lipopolysaccharide export LptBFGC system permease protein LptF
MKLYTYILRQLLLSFLISVAGMVFIAMPGVAVGAVHKVGAAGMSLVLQLVPMMVAVFIPYVLPVALLLSLVSTYGRLASQNEWTAIRMSGVNPYRMLLPAVFLAFIAGAGVYSLNAEVLPRLKRARQTIVLDAFKHVLKNLSPGTTDLSIEGFYLTAEHRDPDDHQTFYDCFISLPLKGKQEPMSFYAKTVQFSFTDDFMRVLLLGPQGTQPGIQVNELEELWFEVPLVELTGEDEKRDFSNPRYLTSGELSAALDHLESERIEVYCRYIAVGLVPSKVFYDRWEKNENRLRFTWHQHWVNAASCLMFVLIGVSTGLLLRKGTQLGALAVAVGIAMGYWIFSLRLGKQLAREGVLEAWIGAWGPFALFAIVGLWLTHKALRE